MKDIVCMVCGKQLLLVNATHLAKHGITAKEYRGKFPGVPMRDPKVCAKQGQTMKRLLASPSARAQMSARFKAAMTDERRQRASQQLQDRWANDTDFRASMSAASSERLKERWQKDPTYRETMAEANRTKWADPTWRGRMIRAFRSRRRSLRFKEALRCSLRASWTPQRRRAQAEFLRRARLHFRERQRCSARRFMQMRWLDPAYREKMHPHVSKWTSEERIVRDWLVQLSVYQAGTSSQIGFLPHRWLPTSGAGFSANGDFVDYNHRLVIHVDGEFWHHNPSRFPETLVRDARLDAWCRERGWGFLRLTDVEVRQEPNECRRRIREFIK